MDMWELLKADQPAEAIETTKRVYEKDRKNPSVAIQLGACYLWLKDWDAAYEHFCNFTEVYPWTTDFAYKFAGTAKWCAEEYESAVDEWKQGVKTEYADMAGGVTIPLHLLFAGLRIPDSKTHSLAIDLLRARLGKTRGRRWPGHLASLVLREIRLVDVYAAAEESGASPISSDFNRWLVEFWEGVVRMSEGDQEHFGRAMQDTCRLTWSDYVDNQELFIAKLRSTEFYLARYEAERLAES